MKSISILLLFVLLAGCFKIETTKPVIYHTKSSEEVIDVYFCNRYNDIEMTLKAVNVNTTNFVSEPIKIKGTKHIVSLKQPAYVEVVYDAVNNNNTIAKNDTIKVLAVNNLVITPHFDVISFNASVEDWNK